MANIDSFGYHYAVIDHELRIGRLFVEYKDNLVVIDDEKKKDREYLISKSKVDHYGERSLF